MSAGLSVVSSRASVMPPGPLSPAYADEQSLKPGDSVLHRATSERAANMQSLQSVASLRTASLSMGRSSDLKVLVPVVPPTLPATWPACVEGRHIPMKDLRMSSGESMNAALAVGGPGTPGDSMRFTPDWMRVWSSSIEMGDEDDASNSRFTLDPSSNFCVGYGVATLLVLAHDAFMVPWTLAWSVPLTGAVLYLSCFSCVFWTLDMFLGFFMGFYQQQRLELRLRKTARHHARTWLLPDLCVVIADWFNILPSLATDGGRGPGGVASRIFRVAKAGKLMRLVGLLRMTKIVKIFEDYIESSLSESSRLALRLVQFFLGIMWLCHILSCIWFAVGHLDGDTQMSWLYYSISQETPQGVKEVALLQASPYHQYVTALHWSMAQISLGANEITCFNSVERTFNCLCLLIGLIGGSTLISSLSATMVDYQAVRKDHVSKLAKLRRYLSENRRCVTKSTALLVQQQAAERLKLTDRVQESDVGVLELVSSGLRMELRFELFQPMLACHGLFQLWTMLDRNTVQRVCLEVLDYKHYRARDDVFFAGTRTDQAYHLSTGKLQYCKEPETAPVIDTEAVDVPLDTWMAEATLWSCWVHVGTARAVTNCEVLIMPAHGVNVMMQHRPEVRTLTGQYAARFHQQIVASSPPEAPYPDDLGVPHTGFEDVVTAMPPSLQKQICLQVLTQVGSTTAGMDRLKREVKNGKCCVLMQPDTTIERTLCFVVLRLTDSRRRLLVEIGRSSGDRWERGCDLPRRQVEQGEFSRSTLARLMSKVGLDDGSVQRSGTERRLEWKQTPEFGVPTKSVLHLHRMSLRDGCKLGLHSLGNVPEARMSAVLSFCEAKSTTTADSNLKELLTEVFLDKRRRYLYAWVTAHVFEHLQTANGERELQNWLDGLRHDLVSEEPPLQECNSGVTELLSRSPRHVDSGGKASL